VSQARLFLALWPDEPVRAELAAWRDAWRWPSNATPVRREHLHVTLHFIGNVEHDRIDALRAALQVPFAPFELAFGKAALWQHGIAVLEPELVPDELPRLHSALGAALDAAALPLEQRIYRPHVTMARRAANAGAPAAGPALRWAVTGYALVESRQGVYTVLEHYR